MCPHAGKAPRGCGRVAESPKLLDIGLGVCSMLTYRVDDFGVGMFSGLTDVHTEQC